MGSFWGEMNFLGLEKQRTLSTVAESYCEIASLCPVRTRRPKRKRKRKRTDGFDLLFRDSRVLFPSCETPSRCTKILLSVTPEGRNRAIVFATTQANIAVGSTIHSRLSAYAKLRAEVEAKLSVGAYR